MIKKIDNTIRIKLPFKYILFIHLPEKASAGYKVIFTDCPGHVIKTAHVFKNYVSYTMFFYRFAVGINKPY